MVKKETDAKGCLSLLGFPGYLYSIYICFWGKANFWIWIIVTVISLLLIVLFFIELDENEKEQYKDNIIIGYISKVFEYISNSPAFYIFIYVGAALYSAFFLTERKIFFNLIGIYLVLIPFIQKISILIEENNNLRSSNESLKRKLNSIKSDYKWMIRDTLSGAMALTESKKNSLEKTLESLEED